MTDFYHRSTQQTLTQKKIMIFFLFFQNARSQTSSGCPPQSQKYHNYIFISDPHSQVINDLTCETIINMGSNQAKKRKCTVSILNYSGIYRSPFEFYGIDNWQELENIGKIFQEQLKTQYKEIRKQTLRLLQIFQKQSGQQNQKNREQPLKSMQKTFRKRKVNQKIWKQFQSMKKTLQDVSQYSRDTFNWQIGEIDRQISIERYSPLYFSQQILRNSWFLSINKDRKCLQNKQQFYKSWQSNFKSININRDQSIPRNSKSENTKYKPWQQFQCKVFDFLCYKSMVLYLYENLNKDYRLYIDYRKGGSKKSFDQIVQNVKFQDQNNKLLKAYKKFLRQYSNRIPKNKLELTLKHFFSGNAPEIMIFTEASSQLILQLKQKKGYFIYSSNQNKKNLLLLVKQSLPFGLKQGVQHLKINLDSTFVKLINGNPFRIDLQNQLEEASQDYIYLLEDYCKKVWDKNSSAISQNVEEFLKQIEDKGLLYWTNEAGILTYFLHEQQRVVVFALHLQSNKDLNFIQAQILGVLIYHLLVKKQKFIIGGVFDYYVSLIKRDKHTDLFDFVKYAHSKQLKQINQLTKKVRVFPEYAKMITAKKKRTILQTQFKKVNQLSQGCIDQIITNYPLKRQYCHISQIKNIGTQKMQNQNFLPHAKHPYDHFLVEATLDLKQQLD